MEIPKDWQNPKWTEYDKVHNWRNYASDELKNIWHTFTDEQKQVIAKALDDMADREEWD